MSSSHTVVGRCLLLLSLFCGAISQIQFFDADLIATVINATIKTPNYPANNYPLEVEYRWTISGPLSSRIAYYFNPDLFEIENYNDCAFDYLTLLDGTGRRAPRIGTYCSMYKPPRIDGTTYTNSLTVIFLSDEIETYAGFEMTYWLIEDDVPIASACDGSGVGVTVNAVSRPGTIFSPGYGGRGYGANEHCVWRLESQGAEFIAVEFDSEGNRFQLLSSASCQTDYVQIIDGSSGAVSGPYCATVPNLFVGRQNLVTIEFVSGGASGGIGFKLRFFLVGIHDRATNSLSSIESDNYPVEYSLNVFKRWVIIAPEGHHVQYYFDSMFEVEPREGCIYDNVEVESGDDTEAQKHCGEVVPDGGITSEDILIVTFHSDHEHAYKGFKLYYRSYDTNSPDHSTTPSPWQACDDTPMNITTSPNTPTYLATPGFPHNYYDNGLNCWWILLVPFDAPSAIGFVGEFSIEQSEGCVKDSVMMHDAPDHTGPILAQYCGDIRPNSHFIFQGTQLSVHFHSDENNIVGLGFRFRASSDISGTACDFPPLILTLTENHDRVTINTRNFPTVYPEGEYCVWIFNSPPGTRLVYRVDNDAYDIEDSSDDTCVGDHLTTYDGTEETPHTIGQFCGETAPFSVTTDDNYLRVVFSSDGQSSVSDIGFEMEVSLHRESTASATCNAGDEPLHVRTNGTITSPGYPDGYGPNMTCRWLVTSSTYAIDTLFEQLYGITDGDSISFVEWHSGEQGNPDNVPIGEYSGDQPPDPFQSSGRAMLVTFTTDASGNSTGFKLHVTEGGHPACGEGQPLELEVGTVPITIQPPVDSFSNEYDNNLLCTWRIRTKRSYRVRIHRGVGRDRGSSPTVITFTFRPRKWPKLGKAVFNFSSPNWNVCVMNVTVVSTDIEDSDSCSRDAVEAFDGGASSDTSFGKYCGSDTPMFNYSTSGDELFIQFTTDDFRGGGGFEIQAVEYVPPEHPPCERLASQLFAEFYYQDIESFNYPDEYSNYMNCTWNLETRDGLYISFNFSSTFGIETSDSCDKDYIAIYDSTNQSAPVLVQLCGTSAPTDNIITTGKTARVVFISDTSNVDTGFKLSYIALGRDVDLLFFKALDGSDDDMVTRNTDLSTEPSMFLGDNTRSYQFDTVSEVDAGPVIDLRFLSFTIMVWISMGQYGEKQFIVSDWSDPGQYAIYVNSANRLVFHLRMGSGPDDLILIGDADLVESCRTWDHVGATWNRFSRQAKLYLNGALIGTEAVAGTDYFLVINGDGALQVGYNIANNEDHFQGLIRNLWIYKGAFEDSEIQAKASQQHANYTRAILGGPCVEHTDCNLGFDPEKIHYSMCVNNVCICVTGYHGNFGSCICRPIVLGTACSQRSRPAHPPPHEFCEFGVTHSRCGTNGKCVCDPGYYRELNNWEQEYCEYYQPYSPCTETAECLTGMTGASCSDEECHCPEGQVFIRSRKSCETHSIVPECKACRYSTGMCYDLDNDGTPEDCECPAYRRPSDPDTWTVGCDIGIVEPEKFCDPRGRFSECRSEFAECKPANVITGQYQCQCKLGYTQLPAKPNPDYVYDCVKVISKHSDINCHWCDMRGGTCIDRDLDTLRDQCICPGTKSSSPHEIQHSKYDCDTEHVNVKCGWPLMTACFSPQNHTKFFFLDEELSSVEYRVFVRYKQEVPECWFKLSGTKHCLTLSLEEDMLSMCDVRKRILSRQTEYYVSVRIQRTNFHETYQDYRFYVWCRYDDIVDTWRGGVDVGEALGMASEGENLKTQLVMSAYDKFGKTASIVNFGDMIQLTIEMTERKDIYSSIKVLMCLASSKPLLNDPRGNVMLLMEEGCPVSDNIAHFTADPTDKRIVSTSLFPIVAFDGSEVFYHCAVSVCRWDDDCAPSTCRVRRSVVQEYGQNDGAFKYGDSDVYSIISPVIRVRRSSGQGTDETGAKYKECTDFFGMGLCKKSTGDIISVTMIGGVACLVIVMLLGVTYWYWRKTGTLEMEQLLEEDDFADGASSFIEMYLQGLDPGIPDFIDVTEMDPGSSEVYDGYEDDMRF